MRQLVLWLAVLLVVMLLVPAFALTTLRTMSLLHETVSRTDQAPQSGQFEAAGDVQLFVQQAGPPDRAAVVLLHGPGTWSELWRPTINALAQAGYRVIAPDLSPFGYSFRPPSTDYSTAAQARRLLALLDALAVPQAIWVAHSTSARAVIELALQAPGRAQALVLVNADLGLQDPPGTDPGLPVRLLLGAGPVLNGVVAGTITSPWLTAELLSRMTARPQTLGPSIVELLQRPQRLTSTTEAIGHWVQHRLLSPEAPASRQPLRYMELPTPTLLVWGADDPLVPLAQAEQLASLLPAAVLSPMRGCGHLPQLEDVAGFNALLLDALGVMAPQPAPARK